MLLCNCIARGYNCISHKETDTATGVWRKYKALVIGPCNSKEESEFLFYISSSKTTWLWNSSEITFIQIKSSEGERYSLTLFHYRIRTLWTSESTGFPTSLQTDLVSWKTPRQLLSSSVWWCLSEQGLDKLGRSGLESALCIKGVMWRPEWTRGGYKVQIRSVGAWRVSLPHVDRDTTILQLHVMKEGIRVLQLIPFFFFELNEMLICLTDDSELRVIMCPDEELIKLTVVK